MMTSNPWWWLLCVLVLIPWVGPFRGSDRVQQLLRSLLFALLAAGMAGLYLVRSSSPDDRVIILDLTQSVDQGSRRAALTGAEKFAAQVGDEHTHLIVLRDSDADKEIDARLNRLSEQVASVTPFVGSDFDGTSPLSSALARAAALIPHTGRGSVTLVTDGLATRLDDARAVSSLIDREIPIHVVPVAQAKTPPSPVSVDIEGELRVGATGRLAVTVSAPGGSSAGEVVLRSGDEELARAVYGGEEVEQVALTFEPDIAGFTEAAVQVEIGDQTPGESFSVVLPVREPIQVLYLGERQRDGSSELEELLGGGFDVTRSDATSLDDFDVVVLDDRPADSVPRELEGEIVQTVQNEGLGLVMSGGRSSFGGGGWHKRPIEGVLPIEFVQQEEKRDPSTSLVIVIDTSGSMTGVRVQLAKEVSRLAMRRLMPHDKVGIVEFYGAKRWAAPLQPASNAIELQRALNRMNAGGGTVILPALEEAFYGLQNVDTRYKHVLVLTDGGVESGDFESLLRRMSKEGINVSTVLTGGGYHSEFLVNLANWGKGRFYNVPDRFNLPEILLKQPSATKLPAYRPGTYTVRARGGSGEAGSGWWGDIDASQIPPVAGYVESRARPHSRVLLETVEGSHPIVATWRFGLGRVTTFMTEPVGEGTSSWQSWSDYGRGLARILERTAADARGAFRFSVETDGAETVVHAKRQRVRPADGDSAPSPHAQFADDPSREIRFQPRSPDHYVARFASPRRGESHRIVASSSDVPDRTIPLVASSPVSRETQVDPRRGLDLPALAAASDGSVLGTEDDWSSAASTEDSEAVHLLSLSEPLFAIALLVFFVEVCWRRRPSATLTAPSSS